MAPKRCPHCFKKVPLKKRLKTKCPFCFKPFRRRSANQDRGVVSSWLEDRTSTFWFLMLLLIFVLLSIIMQLAGNSDLLLYIDEHTFWFVMTLIYAGMILSIVGHIYFPLLLGAPRILRRERTVIRHYKILTTIGFVVGIPFAILMVGWKYAWRSFPMTIFLTTIPVALMWGYQALTLTEADYDDERVWTFMHELGVQDRLEHRHHAYMVLIGIPLSALLFYYFTTHPILANMLRESSESGLIAMMREIWHRTRGH
jgi:hypothetical protein